VALSSVSGTSIKVTGKGLRFLSFLILVLNLEAGETPGRFVDKRNDEELLIETHATEKLRFGLSNHIHYYKNKKTKNTVVEQRSGRRRLYDHNLILRAIFRNQIVHREYGGLGNLLKGAVYIDFGSAILYEEGAVTVRDLFEDPLVRNQLQDIVATDINDTTYDHTRYIEIHEKEREPFPFPHSEIPPLMDSPQIIRSIVSRFAVRPETPLILRSTNSGPDLFYTVEEMKRHFESIIQANSKRHILYFFNRFVFFRHACSPRFQMIGKIDEKIGVNHSFSAWRFVDWKTRTLEEAFQPHYDYVFLADLERLPLADQLEWSWKEKSCHWQNRLEIYFPSN